MRINYEFTVDQKRSNNNLTIKKRLYQIVGVVAVFVMFSCFGLMQVAKGARFHQLNLLHQNAVSRITNLHAQIREPDN